METESYSNTLHEALLRKNGNAGALNSSLLISVLKLNTVLIHMNFASHFSHVFTCNNPHRMTELHDEYNRLHDQ